MGTQSGTPINIYGRGYDVMADRALYMEFAELREGDRQVLTAFASRYGLLGTAIELAPLDPARWPQPRIYGESLRDWTMHIRAIRGAIELRNAIANRDLKYLRRQLHRVEDTGIESGRPGQMGWWFESSAFTTSLLDEEELQRNPGGGRVADSLAAASVVLTRWANGYLLDYTYPSLRHSAQSGKPEIQLVPRTLVGALWLQFALAFCGNPQYNRCASCSRWFELTGIDLTNRRKKRGNRSPSPLKTGAAEWALAL